jgi:hypothetical protein
VLLPFSFKNLLKRNLIIILENLFKQKPDPIIREPERALFLSQVLGSYYVTATVISGPRRLFKT